MVKSDAKQQESPAVRLVLFWHRSCWDLLFIMKCCEKKTLLRLEKKGNQPAKHHQPNTA